MRIYSVSPFYTTKKNCIKETALMRHVQIIFNLSVFEDAIIVLPIIMIKKSFLTVNFIFFLICLFFNNLNSDSLNHLEQIIFLFLKRISWKMFLFNEEKNPFEAWACNHFALYDLKFPPCNSFALKIFNSLRYLENNFFFSENWWVNV